MDSDVINFVEEKFKIFKEEMQKSFDINNEIIKENKSHIEHSISQGHQRDIQIQKIEGSIVQYVNETRETLKKEIKEEIKEEVNEMFQQIKSTIDECVGKINEVALEQSKVTTAEKYSLTKSKLIRLMKDMGYYK